MKLYIILGASFLALLCFVALQRNQISKLKVDNSRLSNNQEVLLTRAESYRVADSLSAMTVRALDFKLRDLKDFRSEDLSLIKELRVDIKRLSAVSKTGTETRYVLEIPTIGIVDSTGASDLTRIDSTTSIQYKSPWIDLNAVVDSQGVFRGSIVCRDSLVYVEHVVPKKFLFFKWGIRERRQDIVSKNPNTTIVSSEFITIKH